MRRSTFLAVAVIAAACHRSVDPSDVVDTSATGSGWCAVRDTLDASCVACHTAGAPSGGLDLQTDPFAAIVGVASAAHPEQTYVVANDPDRSFFLAKMEGTQASDQGDLMPPGARLPDAALHTVRDWIASGATATCDAPTDTAVDTAETDPPIDTGIEPGEEWCLVQDVLAARCASCHRPAQLQAGLDLETDPYAALVNIVSPAHPSRTYVVPYDPDASFLVIKVEDTQAADEGARMPTLTPLGPVYIDAMRAWIAAGAPSTCSAPVDTSDTGLPPTFHPPDWADRVQHGHAADRQDLLVEPTSLLPVHCADCHGADLRGGLTGVGCDSCHQTSAETAPGEGWRTDCTFCHGGTDADTTGAPPADTLGETLITALSFPPHRAHTDESGVIHAPYDCAECHVKPADALSPGHFLWPEDTTHPADPNGVLVAENAVDEPGTITNQWSGARIDASTGSCTVYCHGDGRPGNNGTILETASITTCTACHPDSSSSSTTLSTMSGEHRRHVSEGIECSECHADVTSNGQDLVQPPTHHVDGTVDVHLDPPNGETMNTRGAGAARTCDGSCHDETHEVSEPQTWY